MLSHLSYWPWIIGAGVSFLAALITVKRTVGEIYYEPGVAMFGGGAIAVIFSGLIEASNTGVFVDRGIWDIGDAILGLALTSLISSFVGAVPATWLLYKKWGK